MDEIGRAILNSRPVRWLMARLRDFIKQLSVERLRVLCILFMVILLVCDTVLLFHPRAWSRVSPHYSVIHSVATAGADRRVARPKPFGQAWDSLMADPARKKEWDSLLRLRPGLRDTLQELKRMDSARWSR